VVRVFGQGEFVCHRDFMGVGGASPNPHGVTFIVMFDPAAGTFTFALEVRALDLDGIAHDDNAARGK
jgi:hypothetical protein